MTAVYRDYTIKIQDEPNYAFDSVDNPISYESVYFDESDYQPTSKHGISISRDGQHLASALICGIGGATGVSDTSFIVKDDNLLICCCNLVYSFALPTLRLDWKKQFDLATCFALDPFQDDLIVHGELQISRIDTNGEVKWVFSGKDIFVTDDGMDSVNILGNRIKATDWQGTTYVLNEVGQIVN